MTDQEFDDFLANAVADLRKKQDYLKTEFRLSDYERFFVDYETQELSFFDGEILKLKFSLTEVGTHVKEKDSWKWAWANASVPVAAREKSARLKALAEVTGLEIFSTESVDADEVMAWEFTAIASIFLNAMGAYSTPHKNLRAFMVLDSLIYKNENGA